MYGSGGMYPSYGYNQSGSLGSLLNAISNTISQGYQYAEGGYQQTFGDYIGTQNTGISPIYLIIGAAIIVYLLVK